MNDQKPLMRRAYVVAPLNIIAAGAILTGLIVGSGFLIPLVVAFLVTNVLEAIIERLQRLGLPLAFALPLAVISVLLALAGIVLVFVGQVDDFMAAWPRYLARLESLSRSLLAGLGEDTVARLQRQLGELNLTARLSSAIGSAGTVLVNFLLVILYAGFLLAERGRIYRRLIYLGSMRTSPSHARRTLDNIREGIRQYLFVKTVVSVATGAISYAVLAAIGLDFAAIWAIITFLLNYIPSIGSTIAVVLPALLALLQFETLEPFLVIVGVLAIVQFVIGNVIEPTLMGRSLNLSPFTIVVALMFWGAVWGIAGAFLAVPITAALVILCRELQHWRWVTILLSNEDHAAVPPTPDDATGPGAPGSNTAPPSPT
jgi:predicted PurR-regulated permease PerM